MAFAFQKPYDPAIERQLRQYYQSLSEKDRRRCAAVEAIKLGHGGIRYIAQVQQIFMQHFRPLRQPARDRKAANASNPRSRSSASARSGARGSPSNR